MIEHLVHVRFDLAMSESKRDADRTGFVRVDMPSVPLPGELVNLRGNPCRVIERSWAIGEAADEYRSYAYVRVVSVIDHMKLLREDERGNG